ncbi:hypothetical protein BDQ17DRAFT_1254893, partial [Cyathus striatus]
GQKIFIVDNIPETLVPNKKLESDGVVSCCICGDKKMIKQMHEHVGKYVLAKFRGKPDRGLLQEVLELCGFCGREDVCITTLTKKRNGTRSITSTCEYQNISMKYKATTIFKPSIHCTNVPIHCPFCLPSISQKNHQEI